ncbi:MAG TPA: glutamine--fructose-6-phosphate transaminase (isomerizing) [Polyangiaceae bacterium]|nr:glutamine--fructose-6-phosphate transaminase (isomerizing) [Polyangiaceae bacterium]
MCGIVAYVGGKQCAPVLLEGLRKLEYRGYDSAGLAVHSGQAVQITRAVGKLGNLEEALRKTPLTGTVGIGHTRWATHGRPSEANAHPHAAGGVAVVHNGIIENYVALRRELEQRGSLFSSDTDTEIIAHLVAEAMRIEPDLAHAVRVALARVKGAYAIAVVSKDDPDRVVVAKNESPIVIGIGQGETIAASDIPAILDHTREMIFLHEGEMAVLTRQGATLMTIAGEKVERAPRRIDWSPTQAEKSGYKHFMLKEIHEQPRAIEDTLRGRVDLTTAEVVAEEVGISSELARKIGRVYFVACGTSSHSAMAGRYWVEQLARVPAVVEIGSEVRYREPLFRPDDLVVAVSQSGETIDTLAAAKAAKAQGAHVLALANVLDSAIPRMADGALYTHAGPEIGVASTKCFTTQLAALLLLAVHLGRSRGTLTPERSRRVLEALWHAPAQMRDVLAQSDALRVIARKYHKARDFLFLGRGTAFPIALEGALKLKEISYIHAEGYAAGEMKHGPIALIDENMPVVVVATKDAHYDKTLSNLQEVKAREGKIIAICTQGDAEAARLADDAVFVPEAEPEILPLLTVLPLQLLAYHMADLKGTDVDQPRNLAKTVTVE